MKWVYILECEDDYLYVGETSRLYRRFWEHIGGFGALNTQIHKPIGIVAIYQVNRMGKFFKYVKNVNNKEFSSNIYFNRGIFENFNDTSEEYEYDNLFIENNITEKLMLDDPDNWIKIRGGKYVRFDVDYDFPDNDFVTHLPVCDCGVPCDVRKNEEHGYLFFRCPKKNMWPKLCQEFGIENDPCTFFKKYTQDVQYKVHCQSIKDQVKSLTSISPWLRNLTNICEPDCIGGCGKSYDEDNTIRYARSSINLCFECFIHKHETLARKYRNIGFDKCLM